MTQKPKKGTTPKPKKGAKKKADKRKPGRPSLASQAPPMAQQARSMIRTGGPVPVEIRLSEVSNMAMTMCTIPEIASFYDMSERQFYRRMAQQPEIRLAFRKGRDQGLRTFRQWQFDSGKEGSDAMRVWLGKQYLGDKRN